MIMEREEVYVITTWDDCLDNPDSVVIRDEWQAWSFYEQEDRAMTDNYMALFGFQPENEIHQDKNKQTHVWFEKRYAHETFKAFYTPCSFVSIQKVKL